MSNGRKLAIFLVLLLTIPLGALLAETTDLPAVTGGGSDLLSEEAKFDVVFNDFLLPEVVQYISEKGSIVCSIRPEAFIGF